MASANSDAIQVSCPKCGAGYDFPPSMAGQSGRCAKCNAPFSVPTLKQKRERKQTKADIENMPQYIGVDCRTCGTRLYGRPDQIGQELKCPDCYARMVLPPPPPPKQKDIPAAMFGDQYELAEPDAPISNLVAQQANYIAVQCRKCDTMIYATPQQIGKKVSCPDCGAKHVVPAPTKPKPTRSVISDDAPLIDTTIELAPRPVFIPPRAPMEYESRQEQEYARAVEESRRTGKPMKIDHRGRPVIPRWPLFTGILSYFFAPGVAFFWLGLSAGYFASLAVLMTGIEAVNQGNPIGGMCLFAAGSALTAIVSAAASSFFLTVVAYSSEGSNLVEGAIDFFDWFGDLLTVIVAVMVSAIPGWLVATFLLTDELHQLPAFVGGMVFCLPIVLLSQLDVGSTWGVLSPRVVGSLFRCPFSWLTFYAMTGTLVGGCVAIGWVVRSEAIALAILAPLGTTVLVLYGRLLGRLGWRLAEAMSFRES